MLKKGIIGVNLGLSAALLHTGWSTNDHREHMERREIKADLHTTQNNIREKILSSIHEGYYQSEIDNIIRSDFALRARLMNMQWYRYSIHDKINSINRGILLARIKEMQQIEQLFCRFPEFLEYFEALPDFQVYISAPPSDTYNITFKKVNEHYRVFQAIQQYDPEGYMGTISQEWWKNLPPEQQLTRLQANEFMFKTIQKDERLEEILFRYGLTFDDWQKENTHAIEDVSVDPSYGAILYKLFWIFQKLNNTKASHDINVENDIKKYYSEKMSYTDLKNLAIKLNHEQGGF